MNALADAHIHLFRHGYPSTRGVLARRSEIEAYQALRESHGIAAALVVGYEADGIAPGNNDYIRELAAEHPWMSTVAYLACHPAPAADRIEILLGQGHVGVTVYLHDAAAGGRFAGWPGSIWEVLVEQRAIVSLNSRPEATSEIGQVMRANPGCIFLFSHLGLPGRYPSPPSMVEAATRLQPLLELADGANLRVKISGLYAVSDPPEAHPHEAAKPFVELILDRFGPERCLWGSDFSPALEFMSFAETTTVPWLDRLNSREREQVMGGNLLTLLGKDAQ